MIIERRVERETSFTDRAVSLPHFAEKTVVTAAQGALTATIQDTAILFSIANGVCCSKNSKARHMAGEITNLEIIGNHILLSVIAVMIFDLER